VDTSKYAAIIAIVPGHFAKTCRLSKRPRPQQLNVLTQEAQDSETPRDPDAEEPYEELFEGSEMHILNLDDVRKTLKKLFGLSSSTW